MEIVATKKTVTATVKNTRGITGFFCRVENNAGC